MKIKEGTLLYVMLRDSLLAAMSKANTSKQEVDYIYREKTDTRKLFDMLGLSGMSGQVWAHAPRDVTDAHLETAMRHIWGRLA